MREDGSPGSHCASTCRLLHVLASAGWSTAGWACWGPPHGTQALRRFAALASPKHDGGSTHFSRLHRSHRLRQFIRQRFKSPPSQPWKSGRSTQTTLQQSQQPSLSLQNPRSPSFKCLTRHSVHNINDITHPTNTTTDQINYQYQPSTELHEYPSFVLDRFSRTSTVP